MTDYRNFRGPMIPQNVMERARRAQAAKSNGLATPDYEQHESDDRQDQQDRPQHVVPSSVVEAPQHTKGVPTLTPAEAIALDRVRNGERLKPVCDDMGLSYDRMYRIAKLLDVPLRRGRSRLQDSGTPATVAYMSDTTNYTFPESTPHDPGRPGFGGDAAALNQAFKQKLLENPGRWFELGVIKSGGTGMTNGKGFTFTTRSKDENGVHYIVPGRLNSKGEPMRGCRVWGRYDPPAEQPSA